MRRKTRQIKVGNIRIGSPHPVSIQSMAKVATKYTKKVISQLKRLKAAGCEIVRLSVKDKEDANSIKYIRKYVDIPLVADIHFHYQLALEAIKNGVDKIRLNPGNIYKKKEIKEIVKAAKCARIPIRVGVNSGSLTKVHSSEFIVHRKEEKISKKMVESALKFIRILEDMDFYDIVVSLKSSDVLTTIEAYREMAKRCSYPFHLGITASGLPKEGIIKSSLGLGALLSEGIGDTIRVSLTSSPVEEVAIAKKILQALGLRYFSPQIISCPTCGRCQVDLIKIVRKLEEKLSTLNSQLSTRPVKLAVMGCAVNGPGEAREADLGIAAGCESGVLFRKGKIVKRIPEDRFISVLIEETKKL